MTTRIITTNVGLPTPITGTAFTETGTNSLIWLCEGVSVVGTGTGVLIRGGTCQITLDGTVASTTGSGVMIGTTSVSTINNSVLLSDTGRIIAQGDGLVMQSGVNSVTVNGNISAEGAAIVLGTAGVSSTGGNSLSLGQDATLSCFNDAIADVVGNSTISVLGTITCRSDGAQLGLGSRFTLGSTGSMVAVNGITAEKGANEIAVQGTITARSVGIILGVTATAAPASTVTLGNLGSINAESTGIVDRSGGSALNLNGTINAGSIALSLESDTLVTIGATGSLTGVQGVALGGSGNIICNAGQIIGASTALAGGNNLTLTNTGTISGPTAIANAPTDPTGVTMRINNSGSITGAVNLDVQTAWLNNSGEIFGSVTSDGLVTRVHNSGAVHASDTVALNLGSNAVVVNSGDILSETAGLTYVFDLRLTNTGTISSVIQESPSSSFTLIRNAGVIGTSENLTLFDAIVCRANGAGAATVINSDGGVIRGNISITDTASTVRNDGVIEGNVTLGTLQSDQFDGRGGKVLGAVLGGGGFDTLLGGGQDDSMTGGAGNDSLRMNGGDDLINATLADGDDSYDGGAGFDTLDMRLGTAGIVANLGLSTMSSADFGTDALNDIENLLGGSGVDSLMGDDAMNLLTGADGADTLKGMEGRDTLQGGAGTDKLIGGAGRDVMSGGAGADAFIYSDISDSTPTARDFITDFTDFTSGLADHDRINLTAIDANTALAGDQAFVSIASGAFVAGSSAGKVRFSALGGNTLLEMEVNNDGVADMAIVLQGNHTITSSDYFL